jgi:hypothetical protein
MDLCSSTCTPLAVVKMQQDKAEAKKKGVAQKMLANATGTLNEVRAEGLQVHRCR